MNELLNKQEFLEKKKTYLENKLKDLEENEQKHNPDLFKKERDILSIQIQKSTLYLQHLLKLLVNLTF